MKKFIFLSKIFIQSIFLYYFFHNQVYSQWTSEGTLISDNLSDRNHHKPFIVANKDGQIFISWCTTNTSNEKTSITVSSYNSNGKLAEGWPSEGITISDWGGHYAPHIINSEDGSIIVVWYGKNDQFQQEQIFLQKVSKDGKTLWNNGNPVVLSSKNLTNNKHPMLVSDLNNGCYVCWARYDKDISPNSPDVIVQHVLSTGEVDKNWPSIGLEVANKNNVREAIPWMSLSKSGKFLYVTYYEGGVGSFKLKLKKVDIEKVSVDDSFGEVTVSDGPDLTPISWIGCHIFSDEKDNAIIFWNEATYSDNGEIFMAKISSSGEPIIKRKLLSLLTQEGMGYLDARQIKDNEFLLAFNDYHSNYNIDILKINSEGKFLFSNREFTNDSYSAYPKIVDNGMGGAFVFFKNVSNQKLYGVNVNETGKATSNEGSSFGVVNNMTPFFPQYDFVATSLDKGKAAIAWTRANKKGFMQIYLCNLWYTGHNCTDTVANTPEVNKNSLYIYPNPANEFCLINIEDNANVEDVYLIDYTGKKITINYNVTTSLIKLNLNNITNGIYQVIVKANNRQFSTRILKQ